MSNPGDVNDPSNQWVNKIENAPGGAPANDGQATAATIGVGGLGDQIKNGIDNLLWWAKDKLGQNPEPIHPPDSDPVGSEAGDDAGTLNDTGIRSGVLGGDPGDHDPQDGPDDGPHVMRAPASLGESDDEDTPVEMSDMPLQPHIHGGSGDGSPEGPDSK